jgi:phosphonoacetate hydrolase
MDNSMPSVTVNGRTYALPRRPVVAVCIDGSAPEYFRDGLKRGLLPNLARFQAQGFYAEADCVIPSFTNPNNLSIVTGVPPSVHGISGNYFLDPDTGEEVMMNDPRFLRCESLLAALSRAGCAVAIVTAKDKLRRLLGHGVTGGVCFSSEKAHETTLAEHGIDHAARWVGWTTPEVYSSTLSEFVLEAGVKLLASRRPGVMYLSLTDYIQHKHAPGHPAADAFYGALDRYWGRLAELGALVGLTADHGMNGKTLPDGRPNAIFLEEHLARWAPPGQTRVILPITDPYVVHHGALGSFATIYVRDAALVPPLREALAALPGVDYAGTREDAAARFELPPDRIGDLVVVSARGVVLGKSPAAHDLSLLKEPLRSHGGMAEQRVPFVTSAPLTADFRRRAAAGLRNFDLFDALLNGVAP